MDIIIDLNNKDRKPINIETSWMINIIKKFHEEHSSGIFSPITNFLRRHQHIEKKLTIGIEKLKVDDALICDANKLILMACPQTEEGKEPAIFQQSDMPVSLTMQGMNVPFSLFFNQASIYDSKEADNGTDRTYSVGFDIVLRDPTIIEDGKSKEIYRKASVVNIRFVKQTNLPVVKILLLNPELQFSSIGDPLHKIGDLFVKLPNPLKCAPSVDFKMQLKSQDSDSEVIKDLLQVKDENDNAIDLISLSDIRSRVDAKGTAIPVAKYSLWFDFSKITNPINDFDDYIIVSQARYCYSYQKDSPGQPMHVDKKTIRIKKDKQGTELVVSMSRNWLSGQETEVCERKIGDKIQNKGTIYIPEISFTSKSLSLPVKVILSNKATDMSRQNAGLTISNLKVKTYVDDSSTFILNRQNESIAIDSIVSFQNEEPSLKSGKGFFIPNGDNQYTDFNLLFVPKNIYRIFCATGIKYDLQLISKLEFDYIEDSKGNKSAEKKHFELNLEWTLIQDPNPEWLGVDYGSSAIVCYYGCGDKGGVVDLRNARTKTFLDALKKDKGDGFSAQEIKDQMEINTPFLSSDILFNDVREDKNESSLCSQIKGYKTPKYHKMSVMLSPTSPLIVKNFRRQLPCLKVLMGNEFLPDNVNYNEYAYNYQNEEGSINYVKAIDRKAFPDSLLRIDSIFNETYHTLFRYFIQDESISSQVNQVVLTYPNTYTPRNLHTLNNIVENLFPNVRNVKFVCESDAVAAYYMSHWSDYHISGDVREDENILVYDMGAGTLDVTYLTKRYDEKTNRYTLEICGKIGTGRAGNYLDYVIAQILGEVIEEDFNKIWIGTSMKGVMQEDLEARVELKTVIKNVIKPALSNPKKAIKFSVSGRKFEMTPSDITSHPLFKQFIEQCTDSILQNLKKYIGASTFSVDTVIMSGRSLRLEPLQAKLQKLFKDAECIMLDNVVNGPETGKNSYRTKTAVVEGAKTYVEVYLNPNTNVTIKTRRLQASYGVAYKQTGGRWTYKELLNRSNIPFVTECSGAFTRMGGPVTVKGTNESESLRFIQSYLSEEDTCNALNGNTPEFISEMGEVMMSTLGHAPSLVVDASVDRYNNVSLMVNGQITEGKAPKGVDLNDVITKNSLWPISIEG